MKTNDELVAMAARLRKMRGPADGRGAFLGDGLPAAPDTKIRSNDLADALEELLRFRRATPPASQ